MEIFGFHVLSLLMVVAVLTVIFLLISAVLRFTLSFKRILFAIVLFAGLAVFVASTF